MPVELVENESSWSAFTDIVFIDPAGTGFSRVIEQDGNSDEKKKKKNEPPSGPRKEFLLRSSQGVSKW